MASGTTAAILVEPEIPANNSEVAGTSQTELAWRAVQSQSQYVRRPTRGVQLKKETFATLAVNGNEAFKLRNSSAPTADQVHFTSNFLLQSVHESRQEKFQPISTFGATYGFFFGEQPRFVNCQAILLNTADFQWEAEWWANYDQYLRGTRLVDRGVNVTLTYEDVMLEGYLISADVSKGEPNTWVANLSFSMWVIQVHYLIGADVGANKIASIHTAITPTEWDAFDYDVAGAPTMLDEVRSRNLTKLSESSGSGLIGAIRNSLAAVDSFVGQVGNAIDGALDWLYGRNMVIPAGFAGSERSSGAPSFAGGGGVLTLPLGDKFSGSVTIKAPVRVASVAKAKNNFYDDNPDEYPRRWTAGVQHLVAAAADRLTKAETDPAVVFAETVYSEFGIDVTNDEGQHTSEVLRALGKATYAAISYAATGATAQDAAALAATATSSDYLSAVGEQAAAEALFR